MGILDIGLYLVGSFLVVVFALSYFNAPPGFRPSDKDVEDILKDDPELQPALPKYATERSKYYLYSTVFVLMTLVLYFFVSIIFPYVIGGLSMDNFQPVTSAALVMGTLMFIGLSPKIPFVKELLNSYKQSLYTKAQIPDKGMAVFSYLMYGELDQESESFRRILNIILSDQCKIDVRDSLDVDYFTYDKSRIERMWARLIYLVCCLETWGKQEPFKRHIDSSALCWRQIRSLCVENLLPRMVRYKRGQLGNDSEKEELKNSLRYVLIKVYWLVTLLLFMSNRGGECPEVHLKKIGWVVDPERYFRFSMNQVLFSGAVVLTAILAGAFVGGYALYEAQAWGLIPGAYRITPQNLFNWILFGVPMFVIPLITALQFKRYLSVYKVWEVYKPNQPKITLSQRPWDIYSLVAFASYLATFVVLAVLAKVAPLHSGRSFEDVITPLAMYTLIAPVTALYISYLLDSPEQGLNRGFKFYLRNFLPAVMQGVTNVVIITFCVMYFSENKTLVLAELQADEKAKLMVYAVTTFLIGIAINYSARVVMFLRDRRAATRSETPSSWLTVFAGNIKRRAEAVRQSSNTIEIVADGDLRAVASVGDEIKFARANETPAVGTISSLGDGKLTISFGT